MKQLNVGIVTISDRASQGIYSDESGPAIETFLVDQMPWQWRGIKCIIPDDFEDIIMTLERLADKEGCGLILTTGGTGPAQRDVTPEATATVCTKLLPGFGERMRAASWNQVPTTILSRQIAGIRGKCLIANLPGSPKAVKECLEAVFPAIPHCLELIGAINKGEEG